MNLEPVSLQLAAEPASFFVVEPSCDSAAVVERDASCIEVDQADQQGLDYREEVEVDLLEQRKLRSVDSASLVSSVAYRPFVPVAAVAVAAAAVGKVDRLDRRLVEN